MLGGWLFTAYDTCHTMPCADIIIEDFPGCVAPLRDGVAIFP